jgi:hypothetical protein
MLLQNIAHYNDLSPKFRKELEARVRNFGKQVRYHFKISHHNPDPSKHDGEYIWPFLFTLDPVTFRVTDQHEERDGHSRSKLIGLIKKTDDRGTPNAFTRVRVAERFRGILLLDLENDEQFNMAMYLELHPKNENGLAPDKALYKIFSRIDETASANKEREERKQRKTALDSVYAMSDDEVSQFADGMNWSYEISSVQRNKVEEYAERNPDEFNSLMKDGKIKNQAVIKKAIELKIVNSNPHDGKLTWASTGQTIVVLGMGDGTKTEIERYAEWFATSGDKATEMLNKLKTLVNKPVTS